MPALTRNKPRLLLALALAALALFLVACRGGEEGPPASPEAGEREPSPGAMGRASPLPAVSPTGTANCPADPGPPSQGAEGAGLEGRIVLVRLVLGCSPEVYIMNADGSGARNLTNDPVLDDEPDLSPDGSQVAFFSQREGGTFLYLINADGSGLRRLTEEPGGDTSPRWSPDGSRIAFSRSGSLAVVNADGSGVNIIMEAQRADVAEPCRAGSFVGGWSPDGQRITYYSAILGTRDTLGRWEVCAIDADGSNLEVLVSEPVGGLHAEPTWSPDGKKVAFRDDRDSENCKPPDYLECTFEIYVLDLETGRETNVSNHPALDIEPNWSPDGQWIIFASNRDDPNFDLYVMRPDGSEVRRLLDDPTAKDSYPGWVP